MATPLERVQAAWATGDPLALHREVEQLAAEGHPRQALEDALEALLLEVRTAGADDNTEEIINGRLGPAHRVVPRGQPHQDPLENGKGTGRRFADQGPERSRPYLQSEPVTVSTPVANPPP